MMQEQIKEGNRLIKQFMGIRKFNFIDYYTCWNELMSVVEKIELLPKFKVSIEENICTITGPDEGVYHVKFQEVHKDKQTSVWATIVKFIEFYNENIKK